MKKFFRLSLVFAVLAITFASCSKKLSTATLQESAYVQPINVKSEWFHKRIISPVIYQDASGNLFIDEKKFSEMWLDQTVEPVQGKVVLSKNQTKANGNFYGGGAELIFEKKQQGRVTKAEWNNGNPNFWVTFDGGDSTGVNAIRFYTNSRGDVWAAIPKAGGYFDHANTLFYVSENTGLQLGVRDRQFKKDQFQYDPNPGGKPDETYGETPLKPKGAPAGP
jgi:hypothetical protein